MAAADGIGFHEQVHAVGKGLAVQRHGLAFLEAHGHFLALHFHFIAPELHAHDRLDDADARVQVLEILGLVRGAKHVRVRRIRLFGRHLVVMAALAHELGHFGPAAQFVDELLVQPRLVDLQARVGQQAVAVEALDVVALERAAIAPDIDAIVLHRGHQHRAGHGTADRRGVEVRHAGRGNVECTALQRGDAFGHQLRAAIHQTGFLGAIRLGAAGNIVVVRLVGLTQVGRVGVGNGALLAHPEERGAGVESAREGDSDALAGRNVLQDGSHRQKSR
ncbi:hypothetical protein D3C86_1277580 [compost metagenome]